jgi:hypothetical protein
MFISESNQQIKPVSNYLKHWGEKNTSTEKRAWESWAGFYGIQRHVPTAGIQVGPKARMRAILLI